MPSERIRPLRFFALVTLFAGACSGSTGGSSGADDATGGSDEVPGVGGSDGQICDIPKDGWTRAPMRRLTAVEYDNAVSDLLGDKNRFAERNFSADEAVAGFNANIQVAVGVSEAEKLGGTAQAVGESAITRMAQVLKCSAGQGDEACALSFVERFGRLAFRRDLTGEEKDLLSGIYKNKAKATDHTQGVRLVIEAVLQMPQFLYRPILGNETAQDGVNKLTGDEVASRLSFFLWSSVPDADLLDAAASGDLDSSDGLKSKVEQMMKDPRFDRTLESFAVQWLGLGALPAKDEMQYPGFSDDVWLSAKTSVGKFFSYVTKETDGHMERLFTEPFVFADQKLAKTYGMTVKADSFEKMPTDAKRRGGIITQAAVLATLAGSADSSPVKRGVFVRSRLLCQAPPPPPPTGVPQIAPDAANKTTRQRLEEHRANPTCAACHAFFDPVGLAFENFDGVGAYREKENNVVIDASGELTDTDVDGKFTNAMDLMGLLKNSNVAAECLTNQFYRFAVGRLESEAESCVLKRVTNSLMGDGYSIRDAFANIATSDAFRFVGRN